MREPSKPSFLIVFSLFQQKLIKNVFYCKFFCRIRIGGQLDSGNCQKCLKVCFWQEKGTKPAEKMVFPLFHQHAKELLNI